MLLGKGLATLGRLLLALVSRSRIALVAVVIIAVLGVGALVDLGMNWGKAYAGVRIGSIDVSGKTAEEMKELVNATYQAKLANGHVIVYANDDAQARVNDAMAQAEDAALAEQRSVEEARANRQLWEASAQELGAALPTDDLVKEALALGREDGGLLARVGMLFGGRTIDMRASYVDQAVEKLASDVDATIGTVRVDYNVAVSNGSASVTDGHDGDMVNRTAFAKSIDRAFFDSENGQGSFVAKTEHAPLRVQRADAQKVCDQVNDAIAYGARFSYENVSWEATPANFGDWISTRIVADGSSWRLEPYVDEAKAKPSIVSHIQEKRTGSSLQISFENNNGNVVVHTDGAGTIPKVHETVSALNALLFNSANSTPSENVTRPAPGQPVEAFVASDNAPASASFDEALSLGLVSEISSYTTNYTSGAGTENRNHNIHLVSDLLTNSIVKPGESWSFNGTAGDCNAERGFLGAGAILDGEYVDAVGGGICQVATTVFNSVYDAGFPVTSRRNHSLYIASYPAGRDAAVSWPDLDLVWKNDSATDVLVRTSYTDSSITVSLYGIDPDYQVSTSTGEWVEGEKHSTKTQVDQTMTPGSSYVKTAGTDGKSITVIRKVTAPDGTVLHEDVFQSTYDPVNEVVVAGPEAEKKDDAAKKPATGAAQ